MTRMLVSGLINIETTLKVDSFPLTYEPVRYPFFGINRPFLSRAQEAGVLVATDVHTISDVDDHLNADFMAAAHIPFLSDENLPGSPEEFARRLLDRYGTAVIVIGLGQRGALLSVRDDNFLERVPAVQTCPVVNTIGAGTRFSQVLITTTTILATPMRRLRKRSFSLPIRLAKQARLKDS